MEKVRIADLKNIFFDRDLKNDEFERMNWRHTCVMFSTRFWPPFYDPKLPLKASKCRYLLRTTQHCKAPPTTTLTVIAGNMIYNETTQTQIVCRDFDDKK